MNPPVALSHICSCLSDLVYPFISGEDICINTSAQPNSAPHLGTVTTLFSAFSIAKLLARRCGVNASVTLDILENAKGKSCEIGGKQYQYMLSAVFDEGSSMSLANKYESSFKRVLDVASRLSGIGYRIRSYREFQMLPWNRAYLFSSLEKRDNLRKLLNPNGKNIHVRIPCPTCGLIEKSSDSLEIERMDSSTCVLSMICPHHGRYTSEIDIQGNGFVDTGTSVRDIVKVAGLAKEGRQLKSMPIMVDGADWGGAWAWMISMRGAHAIGACPSELPFRYFTPAIVDSHGVKFSKSIYVSDDTYRHLPAELLNSDLLLERCGESPLKAIFMEVENWVSRPSSFLRNYTLGHFVDLFRGSSIELSTCR